MAFNVISTNAPFIRDFFIKNIIFLFFSKLNLSTYLSYYLLSIAFYSKNYYIFYYSFSKISLKFHSSAGNHLVMKYTYELTNARKYAL